MSNGAVTIDHHKNYQRPSSTSVSKATTKKNDKKRIEHWKAISGGLLIYDVIAVAAAFFMALWLRFDLKYSSIPEAYLNAYLKFTPVYVVVCVLVFWCCKLYQSLWRYASYKELLNTIIATFITFLIQTIGITLFVQRMPISYYIWGILFQFVFVIGVRFSYRFYLLEREVRDKNLNDNLLNRVMVIGAGNAGQLIIRDIQNAKEVKDKVCCILDDDPNKWGRFIDNIPIVGGRDDILTAATKYKIEKIYVAIPSATAQNRRDIINICQETGCQIKNLPALYQLVNGDVSVSRMKNVAIEDLLGREPIKTDLSEVFSFLNGKTVLVTGGGGSIGSELARQVASHKPKRLILFDVYENNEYEIQQELRREYGTDLDLVCLIGSVRDSRRIWEVFDKYRPDIVYHAAAHKHVPLMEDSPCEAIKNNAIGTYKTAYAAVAHGVQRFVLISTDKAVNPTNVMGATKRMCEMIIQTFDHCVKNGTINELPEIYNHSSSSEIQERIIYHQTQFVAVRFGNVLGSNGSVIPLFKKQIENGGPVTVTHPDIIRYFMTIPEAVSLVLEASYHADGGEIFVLDMGDPVRIDDLARNLIKLSGLKPNEDIDIVYTGLRPGEKLYEEKLMAEEGLETTENKLIHIGKPVPFDKRAFIKQLREIMDMAYLNEEELIREKIMETVSTYHPQKNKVS